MAKRIGSHQAVYNAGGITLPDGAETGLFVDAAGNLLVSQGTLRAGEDVTNNRQIVESRWQYKYAETASSQYNIAASITSGIFHGVTIGDINGGGYIIVKDSTDGSGSTTLGVIVPSDASRSFVYDIPFTTGLNFSVNNTTAANPMKVTVMYRENA